MSDTTSKRKLAIKNLSDGDLNRLRLKLERRFGEQLRNIQAKDPVHSINAQDTDDLLHEAIIKFLTLERNCPNYQENKKTLLACLFHFVRGEVSNLYGKSKRQNLHLIPYETDRDIETSDATYQILCNQLQQQEELRDALFVLLKNDGELSRLVQDFLDCPDGISWKVRGQKLGISSIYRTKKRLAALLKPLSEEYDFHPGKTRSDYETEL